MTGSQIAKTKDRVPLLASDVGGRGNSNSAKIYCVLRGEAGCYFCLRCVWEQTHVFDSPSSKNNRETTPDELCEHLWPSEDPEQTQGRLHVLVHDLRQALEPDPQPAPGGAAGRGGLPLCSPGSLFFWTWSTSKRCCGRRSARRGGGPRAVPLGPGPLQRRLPGR